MLDGKRTSDLVALCQEFVRRPSVSGREADVARCVAESMRSLGYDGVSIDSCGNVLGRIRFSAPGGRLLMEAQMDHVETGDPASWSRYPYGAFIDGGRVYGRGAADQKGSLAAMILAGAFLKQDLGAALSGELFVAATVQQERFEGFSSRAVGEAVRPDRVILGEATDLQIARGQRGRAEIVVETHGVMAHSAHPEYGVNAANKMVKLISALKERFRPPTDPFLGKGILVLTSLCSSPIPGAGAIPDRCTATFDRRLLLGETRDAVVGQIRDIVDWLGLKDSGLKADVHISKGEERCYTGSFLAGEHFAPAWVLSPGDEFLERARAGLERVGLPVRVCVRPGFGTNGCHYAGSLGLPAILFGPSRQDRVHGVDEFIEIDELVSACRGYYGIAASALDN